jgi:predicted transposase YdaD
MLHLPDIDLKQTRFYQQAVAKGHEEGRAEGRTEGYLLLSNSSSRASIQKICNNF